MSMVAGNVPMGNGGSKSAVNPETTQVTSWFEDAANWVGDAVGDAWDTAVNYANAAADNGPARRNRPAYTGTPASGQNRWTNTGSRAGMAGGLLSGRRGLLIAAGAAVVALVAFAR